MTIDLKFLIVPALPFVVLGLLRTLWFAAGAEWTDPTFAAFFSGMVGVVFGGLIVAMMHENGVKYPLRIGGKP